MTARAACPFQRKGLQPAASIEVRSGQVACSLVAHGGGVAFVDELTARAFAPHGLVSRPVQASPAFTVHAVLNKERPPPMLAKALGELIAHNLTAHH